MFLYDYRFSVDLHPLSELGEPLLHDDVDGAFLGGPDVDQNVAPFGDSDGKSQH